jgi:3'-phosphoadenosine 5'-phosphosulfate (PAPS) 3'-phosphatase
MSSEVHVKEVRWWAELVKVKRLKHSQNRCHIIFKASNEPMTNADQETASLLSLFR